MILAVLALLAADADVTNVEARALFDEGRREYDAARYAEARAWFERAWDKKALPELLFNIGQCDFQLGDYEEAIERYERYLTLAPAAENRALVVDLIHEARVALAAQPDEPSALDTARATFASVVEPAVAPGTPTERASDVDIDDTWLWAGAIAGTIAVVAVGGAVAFALASPGPTLGVIDGRAP